MQSRLFFLLILTMVGCSRSGGSNQVAALSQTWLVADPPQPIRGWELVDGAGQSFTEQRLVGRLSLLFVGYTRCPDVCPATLSLLRDAKPLLPNDIQMLFLSVDSQDSAETVGQYTTFFQSGTGLVGDVAAVKHATQSVGAAFSESSSGSIDHSTSLFVIDETATLIGYLLRPNTPERVARDLAALRDTRPPRVQADLWAPPMPPQSPGVAYGRLASATPVTVTGARSVDVERVELHRTVHTATQASMEPVSRLVVSPDSPAVLQPGGLHLMLLGERRSTTPVVEFQLAEGPPVLVRLRQSER